MMRHCIDLRPGSQNLLGTIVATVLAMQPLKAQTVEASPAAGAITATDLIRHVGVITHDSTERRDTPSPGLDRAAQYVADQFKAVGLEPAGDSGSWVWRYPVPRHSTVAEGESQVQFLTKMRKNGKSVVDEEGEPQGNYRWINFATAAIAASDTLLDSRAPGAQGGGQGSFTMGAFGGPAPVVIAGPHTAESVRQARLRDRIVIYVPPPGTDSTAQRAVLELLRATNHVIIIADEDSAAWAARRRAAQARPPVVLEWYLPEATRPRRWTVIVWARAIETGLATAGFALAEARASVAPIVRELNAVGILAVRAAARPAAPTAPNVLGVLRGREQGAAIVISAHMDRAGPNGRAVARGADTTVGASVRGEARMADDNAAAVAGLIALAKEFEQSHVTPRHSIVFAAVSGGAKEFWGSSALVDNWTRLGLGSAVMDVNLDALGSGPHDTVYVDGVSDFELPVRPAWLASKLPGTGLVVLDGGSAVAPISDHFPFVRKLLPALNVHGSADAAAALDGEQLARRLQFAFVLARELAEAGTLPRWTTAGRERRSRFFER